VCVVSMNLKCVCVCACMCVRACVHACVCAYVRVCAWSVRTLSMHYTDMSTYQFIPYYASVYRRTHAFSNIWGQRNDGAKKWILPTTKDRGYGINDELCAVTSQGKDMLPKHQLSRAWRPSPQWNTPAVSCLWCYAGTCNLQLLVYVASLWSSAIQFQHFSPDAFCCYLKPFCFIFFFSCAGLPLVQA